MKYRKNPPLQSVAFSVQIWYNKIIKYRAESEGKTWQILNRYR
jgi:hypothetical protein